jgi:hypothetical protein
MVVREESRPAAGSPVPDAFRAAVAAMHAVVLRPEIFCEEMPAPQRIAPYASALSADVEVAEEEVGTGRLILLHDPEGNDAWAGGTFRCVLYTRAQVDFDLVNDPMLGEVCWSWLTEALQSHGAAHQAIAGSVTRVTTESFGAMADDPGTAQVEIRASWTPVPDEAGYVDVGPHVEAWAELMCTAVGLPPVPEGVAVMPSRRGQRGPA